MKIKTRLLTSLVKFFKLGSFLFLFFSAVAGPVFAGQPVHTHIPPAAQSQQAVGRLEGTNRLSLAIALPLRNQDALAELVKDVSDPSSPNFRHYLGAQEFAGRFGPSQEDYEKVKAFCRSNGWTVTGTHANRMLVDVSGAAADIERGLHVKLNVYRHPKENREFYAPDSQPSLDLDTPVLDVSGLENYSLPKPLYATNSHVSGSLGMGPGGTYMGKDFRAAYAPDTTLTGTGQSVGLLQFDGYSASDITAYEVEAGLPNVPLTNVLLDGFSGAPTGNGGEVEVSLDIEMAISMAPQLSEVIVYMAGPSGNFHDILNRMASDNLAKQLSCSWYEPSVGADPVAEQIFQEMAAQGQTFFAASGDYDAYTSGMPFPDDSPHITLVGGTTLSTSGPGGSYVSETVWNWGDGIGSAGGISASYAIPSWQTNISMANNQGSTTMRNVPDVALTADNVDVRADGRDQSVGGTSCASPLWAGMTALVNQLAALSGRPPVGFINPALDLIGTGQGYAAAFHDITTGNNTSQSSPSKFFAVAGYDLCTGWGTPAGQAFINGLAVPDPLTITPLTGFASAGASGGPFTVTSQALTLTNSGTNTISWAVLTNASWLNISPSGGNLLNGGPATQVTASLNAAAYGLPIGTYTAPVAFSNITTSNVQTRQFTLQVVPSVPPGIVTQPTNVTIFVGFTANFSVGANGTPPLNYQWQFNSTNIAGATNSTLTLSNVSYNQAGSYSVVVANNFGSTNSASAILTVNPPPPCAPVPSGLISWWQGEGNAADAAGLNNGTLVNGVTFAPGEVNQAFSFNGNDQYVQIPDSPSLRPQSVSLECWLNAGAVINSGNLISKPVGSAYYDSYQIWFEGSQLRGAIGNTSGLGTELRYSFIPTPGIWYHAAYTFDSGSGTQALYLNGSAVATGPANTTIEFDSNPLLIGTEFDYGSPVLPFDGEIDEVSIYNRALTSVEVASIYAAAFTGKCPLAPTPPIILVQPTNQTAIQGFGATFNITAEGTAPLSYQWQFNTTNVNGATNAGLILRNLTFAQAGSYSVVVSNAYGVTNSAIAILTVNPAPPCAPVTAGLISWWPAEGNANDVASTNNGTLVNGVTFLSGEAGEAFAFNGQDQYVQVPDSLSLRPASVTLECWFNASNTSGVGNLISKPVGTGYFDSYQLWFESGNLNGVVGSTSGLGIELNYSLTPVPGTWYHAAYTFDAPTQKQVLYVNGVAVASGKSGTAIEYDQNSLFLGTEFDYGSPVLSFAGRIDEAAIYNRALSAQEVASIYAAGAEGKCPLGPSVYGPPVSQTVAVGSNVTFTVRSDGSPPLSYQWSDDGTNIVNGTNSALVLTNVQLTNAGTYSVTVNNSVGVAVSSGAVLTVGNPPSITAQPQDQEVPQGSNAVFSVSVAGSGQLSYQWYFEGIALQGGTGSFLTLSNVVFSESGSYYVAVSSDFGSIVSSNVVLTVDAGPAVISQPTNITAYVGYTASFSVTVTGSLPFTYQWEFDGTNITASTNATLVLTNLSFSESGSYSVVVSNSFGSVISSNAVLTVIPTPECDPAPSGLVSWWAANANALDSEGLNNGTLINGASYAAGEVGQAFSFKGSNQYVQVPDSPSLRPASVTLECWFQVNSTDGYGNLISKPVGSGIYDSYTIWLQNGELEGEIGIPSAAAPILSYNLNPIPGAWYHAAYTFDSASEAQTLYINGVAVASGPTGMQMAYDSHPVLFGTEFDSGSPVLSLNGQVDEISIYNRALSSNEIGAIYASSVTGKCPLSPDIFAQPQNENIPVGSNAMFSVGVGGTPPLVYQWSENGTNIANATNSSFILTNVQLTSAGSYSVTVTNQEGLTNSISAVLQVGFAPLITNQPQSQQVAQGAQASMAVGAAGTPPLNYQWYLNGVALSQATNSIFTLTNIQLGNAGTYNVVVSNLFGASVSSNAVLSLGSQPIILSQPQSQAAGVGSNVTFSVVASELAPSLPAVSSGTMELWLRADAGVITNSNGLVNAWLDQSGNGNNAAQTNSNYQPALVSAAGIGGRAAVRFSGVLDAVNGDWLQGTSNLGLTNALTSFVFYNAFTNWVNVHDLGSELWFVGTPSAANNTRGCCILQGALDFTAWNVNFVAPFIVPTNTYRICTDRVNTNLSTAELFDLTQNTATNFSESMSGLSAPGAGYWIGGLNPSLAGVSYSRGFNGDISEVIIYRGYLTDADRIAVANYLAVKYYQSGLSYQWRLNGASIPGATGTSLVLTNVQLTNSGSYSVVVTNFIGSTISSNALLTVGYPPSITNQPESQEVGQGASVTFLVGASGIGPFSYQWSLNGTALSFATNSSLVLTGVQATNDGTYSVSVGNQFGATVSSSVILTVDLPPTIVNQPQNQTVLVGSNVTFSVGAEIPVLLPTVTSGNLALWLKADAGVVTNSLGQVSAWLDQSTNNNNATQTNTNNEPTLVKPGALGGAMAVRFNGIQDNVHGSYMSGTGNVGLSGAFTSFVLYNYFGTTNHDNVICTVGIPGTEGTLRAEAIVSSNMLFSFWSIDYPLSFAPPTNTYRIWTDRVNSNVSTLQVYENSANSSTNFTVSMSGALTPAAGYWIGGYNPSLQYVVNSRCFPGDIAEWICYRGYLTDGDRLAVQGYLQQKYFQNGVTNGLTYQWQFDGTNISNATNSSLTLSNVQLTNAGTYAVIVSNGASSVISSNALLTVDEAPYILGQPQNLTIIMPANANFAVAAPGFPKPAFQWFVNGATIGGAIGRSLFISNAVPTDGGTYSVVASNIINSATSTGAVLLVDYFITTMENQATQLATTNLTLPSHTQPGMTFTITGVNPTSAQGGSVQLAGGIITYTPPTGFLGVDTFNYTMTPASGPAIQGEVTVVVGSCYLLGVNLNGGNATIRFAGTAGTLYYISASSDLVNWTVIGSVTAPPSGIFPFIDPDAGQFPYRFYKTTTAP